MKSKSLALIGMTILLSTTLVACSSGKSSNTDSKGIPVARKATKKATNKDQLGLTKSEVAKFNDSLLDGLNEDQSYADSGDDGYSFAKYIDTISYDSNRGLKISVTSDFNGLSETDKNTVAGKAVGLAEAQLVIIGKNDNGDKTIHSNVYLGKTKLGSAKLSSPRKFNWKH